MKNGRHLIVCQLITIIMVSFNDMFAGSNGVRYKGAPLYKRVVNHSEKWLSFNHLPWFLSRGWGGH